MSIRSSRRTSRPGAPASGGNLQRTILAREISAQTDVMVAMQPTRGLDVGAIEGVQRLLLAQREAARRSCCLRRTGRTDGAQRPHRGHLRRRNRGRDCRTRSEHDVARHIGLMMTGEQVTMTVSPQLPHRRSTSTRRLTICHSHRAAPERAALASPVVTIVAVVWR